MNQDFDVTSFDSPVFKKVLGLPEDKRLEDWYDVLQLSPSVGTDGEVEQAIVSRIQEVRRYEVGAYQDQALVVLEELAKAYTWLTDTQERQRYNESRSSASSIDEEVLTWSPDTKQAPVSSKAFNDQVAKKPTAPRPPRPRQPAVSKGSQRQPTESGPMACPKCGKKKSAKAKVCYHCGFRVPKPAVGKHADSVSRAKSAATTSFAAQLVRQDLSPDQLLARLGQMKAMTEAAKVARHHWIPPTQRMAGRRAYEDPRSRCDACRRPLLLASDAYALKQSSLDRNVAYLSMYAQKMASLGKGKFQSPLSPEDIRRVRDALPQNRSDTVRLFCRNCVDRYLKSPTVSD